MSDKTYTCDVCKKQTPIQLTDYGKGSYCFKCGPPIAELKEKPMKKFIKLKYKKKNDKGILVPKEMLINRNTINRVIESKSVVIISTPKFPMGYKNQVIKLDKEDFKHLMEQIC